MVLKYGYVKKQVKSNGKEQENKLNCLVVQERALI